jgi:16S rRNA (guanine966-N2)-methyltransferase
MLAAVDQRGEHPRHKRATTLARKRKHSDPAPHHTAGERDPEVRIIGGEFRGRRLHYHGDPVVRPMKHRTREAIFNLISTESEGRHAIDLFSGTGALGLEALSRGAPSATFIEKHVPTARVVEENIHTLGVEDRSQLIATSAFLWAKRDLPNTVTDKPWLVFCSPPYAFYQERQGEMLELLVRIQQAAPRGSILIVEAEVPFDFDVIRNATNGKGERADWDIRVYQPAIIGIWRAQ